MGVSQMPLKDISIPEGLEPNEDIQILIETFLKDFKPLEIINNTNLLLMCDKKSEAYYLNCHLDSKVIIQKVDLNAVLDPEDTEEYKLNHCCPVIS